MAKRLLLIVEQLIELVGRVPRRAAGGRGKPPQGRADVGVAGALLGLQQVADGDGRDGVPQGVLLPEMSRPRPKRWEHCSSVSARTLVLCSCLVEHSHGPDGSPS